MKITELPPSAFQFGNYDGGCIQDSIFMGGDKYFTRWMNDQVIRGYQRNPDIRPRTDSVAVMFEFDGNEYWSHVPNRIFEQLIGESK